MTIREAAERIGKHNDTIRRAIQSGKLESTKVKGIWDISDTALAAYMKRLGISGEAAATVQPYAKPDDEAMQLRMQELVQQIEELKSQLGQEREGVEEARKAAEETSQRHDTIVLQLTRQNQQLLEYHQEPWYRRWFRRRKSGEEI